VKESAALTMPPRRPSNAASAFEQDALSWLASQHVDELAQYLSRGRLHRNLTAQQLTERWIEAMKRRADDPRNPEMRATLNALACEFDMRGSEPPYVLAREDFERYMCAVAAIVEEIKNEDRNKLPDIGRGLEADVEAFKAARDKSKN
jgi:hypothetical protein